MELRYNNNKVETAYWRDFKLLFIIFKKKEWSQPKPIFADEWKDPVITKYTIKHATGSLYNLDLQIKNDTMYRIQVSITQYKANSTQVWKTSTATINPWATISIDPGNDYVYPGSPGTGDKKYTVDVKTTSISYDTGSSDAITYTGEVSKSSASYTIAAESTNTTSREATMPISKEGEFELYAE